jgi:hypothetical protein
MAALASLLGVGPPPPTISTGPPTISGREYLLKLRKYLGTNLPRLAPRRQAQPSSWLQHSLQQSYTVLTLGLDPTSAPLSPAVKVPLTLGLGSPAKPASQQQRPLLLRLPPDKLLYLLLRWQSLPQALPHVGHTDVPVPDGVEVGARAARNNGGNSSTSSGGSTRQLRSNDGDVESVRSWVGSIRTVSMPIQAGLGGGWWSKPQEVDEGESVEQDMY